MYTNLTKKNVILNRSLTNQYIKLYPEFRYAILCDVPRTLLTIAEFKRKAELVLKVNLYKQCNLK